MINNKKDMSRCKIKGRINLSNDRDFLALYIWKDKKALAENAYDIAHPDGLPEEKHCLGCFNPLPYKLVYDEDDDIWITEYAPKLGELHFISGRWNNNIASHEWQHAMLHFARVKYTDHWKDLGDQYKDIEEEFVHELSSGYEALYGFLWEYDPHGEHAKKETT